MKKCVSLLLVLLLSMVSVTAVAEVDFSSYTEAELRALRVQLDKAIAGHCRDEGRGKAVCDAFIQYMQELGHSLEYDPEKRDEHSTFWVLQEGDKEINLTVYGGYNVLVRDGFAANNESYTRDCMVALAMAVAQVEGVEIFNNEISTAMSLCKSNLPDGFYKDNIDILWSNWEYGYRWFMVNNDGTTLIYVL